MMERLSKGTLCCSEHALPMQGRSSTTCFWVPIINCTRMVWLELPPETKTLYMCVTSREFHSIIKTKRLQFIHFPFTRDGQRRSPTMNSSRIPGNMNTGIILLQFKVQSIRKRVYSSRTQCVFIVISKLTVEFYFLFFC